jgi:dipeptidase
MSGCTIGAVFTKQNKVFVFKNRDLNVEKTNPEPTIENGEKYRYIKFGVDVEHKKPGVWAGVNDGGVAVLGADGNCILDFQGGDYGGGEKTWEAYETVLSKAGSVEEAYKLIIDLYTAHKIGGSGDIVLIADRSKAAVLEYSLNQWAIQFITNQPYVLRTNFFVGLRHLRPAPEENSLHLSSAKRYERAIELLSKTTYNTSLQDVKNLCRDHINGPSAFSICRHGGGEEYKTCCSVIFEVGSRNILAHYIINEFPCNKEYTILELK